MVILNWRASACTLDVARSCQSFTPGSGVETLSAIRRPKLSSGRFPRRTIAKFVKQSGGRPSAMRWHKLRAAGRTPA
jgi:hypothetical protein